MPKNTKTMGLIPRSYALLYSRGINSIALPPTAYAEALLMAWPESIIKKQFELANTEHDYSELEEGVFKKKKCYNLLRKEGILSGGSEGGTVVYGKVKSRRHGGHSNATSFTTEVKGVQTLEGILNVLMDTSCGCEQFTYSRGSDESRVYQVVCPHIALTHTMPLLGDLANEKISHCKPLLPGETSVPFDFINHPEYVIENAVMTYIENKKIFERDRILMEKPDIITKPFQDAIKAGTVKFSATKDCENYPYETKHFVGVIARKLKELKAVRNGIAFEQIDWSKFDIKPYGNCFWNYDINNCSIRIIPEETGASFTISFYDPKFIDVIKKAEQDPKFKEAFDNFQKIDIDPMTKKERVLRIHGLASLKGIENIIF